MCGTCGCADPANEVSMTDTATGHKVVLNGGHDHGHDHDHDHDDHHHGHDEPHVHGPGGEIIPLEVAVLSKNDKFAAQNRGWFEGRGVVALNLVSSPGSGKTTLLEATIRKLAGRISISVIEGDQMTSNDAERIKDAGARAIQINTGAGCHLEADMVARAAKTLDPEPGSIVMIENVGNLVCPAMFDLGERMKIAVISTTEGEDKPIKYPHMFRAVELVIINKMDLVPHVDFDEETCRANIAQVNPDVEILCLSAKTGDGMDAWCRKLQDIVAAS
jgi:hydrogenase nickel incorporation protein HypB